VSGAVPALDYSDASAHSGKGSTTQWGDDLGAEDEALLVADYETPVFV
jgi:asparaginyl-tRNA synthetase